MFHTDEALDLNGFNVNCLHFYSPLDTTNFEKINLCFGPLNRDTASDINFINTRDKNLTFRELYELRVTSKQLLAWSATIDLAERYQHYIDHSENPLTSSDRFFNCTKPWFGPQCRYSFGLGTINLIENVILKTWRIRHSAVIPNGVSYLTCYIHLQCYRGGQKYCLDWREICDGNIDCIDGGIDEAECFELEVNECETNEYRCHNGLCIAKEFLDDESAQCLDTSDMIREPYMINVLIDEALIFNEEERLCRPGKPKFSCGDGTCMDRYTKPCKTGRKLHFIESISHQGSLPRDCWVAMVCLTKIRENIDRLFCDQLLNSSNITTYWQNCADIIQFPVLPVAFGHVSFLYRRKNTLEFNNKSSLKPDYICYDRSLCDFLVPTYFHGLHTCRHTHEVISDPGLWAADWTTLVDSITLYFRKCSVRQNKQNYSKHPTLYCCKNSSKCISKSRILDGISDCYLDDDEQAFNISCSIENGLRSNCSNENKCYSPLIQKDVCPGSTFHHLNQIQFDLVCDRIVHTFPVLINGHSYNDETECGEWPCNNYYTRCNGFWNCPHGEDEENCTKSLCPAGRLPCVLLYNHTLVCLPAKRVGDGIIDCLGALDEMDHCLRDISDSRSYFGFRCMNSTTCLRAGHLCDGINHCPSNDDEVFCNTFHLCQEYAIDDFTEVEQAICRIGKMTRIPFRMHRIPQYPILNTSMILHAHQSIKQQARVINFVTKEPEDPAWPWRCNQGYYVRNWLGRENFTYICICPPSYYGNHCQYQNQRVSLTLRVTAISTNSIYVVVIILFDDDNDRQEIESHEQFTTKNFGRCEQNFNVYLTYQTRPKNMSKNYSIRIDAFEKISLTYIGSWHFKVPFAFLPVNRMAQVLIVPVQPIAIIEQCSIECHNGKCMKYINQEKFYCRCHPGWYGAQCQIRVRCSDCSNDSVCVGMIHNRSICVCPVNKWGLRCLLNLSCPEDVCMNGGRCFATIDPENYLGYACLCPPEFSGSNCHVRNFQLEIAFNNTDASPFMLLYYLEEPFSVSYLSQVKIIVMPYRITMFQHTLSTYSSIMSKIVFAKISSNIYLIVSQLSYLKNLTTSIDSKQRCADVKELLKPDVAALPEIRKIKYYFHLCGNHSQLPCFYDEFYMCLCDYDSQPHCFNFEHTPPKCQHNIFCKNGGECWQDDAKCPKTTVCSCAGCFFGHQCEFYGKGIGVTLDDIFRYEIIPNSTIRDQSELIKSSIALTMMILVGGWINSALAFLTFRTKCAREFGSGIYLLASSITSFLTVNIFAIKFWLLILSQISLPLSRAVFARCCISFEFILKICRYSDNWLTAFVAIERSMTAYKGINFNKIQSKLIAQRMIFIIIFIVAISFIHEPLSRQVFDDKEENRLWCALRYSSSVHGYNTFILLVHFAGPLACNLISAIFIILTGVRRRARAHRQLSNTEHLRQQLKEHKNLIIGPIALVILSLPQLIISLFTGCLRASRSSWLYLIGYIVSFLPSISIFFAFILPSKFYMAAFKSSVRSLCRCFSSR